MAILTVCTSGGATLFFFEFALSGDVVEIPQNAHTKNA